MAAISTAEAVRTIIHRSPRATRSRRCSNFSSLAAGLFIFGELSWFCCNSFLRSRLSDILAFLRIVALQAYQYGRMGAAAKKLVERHE
ncbi:MAG: hypothetical protein DMF56_03300 [Acidobacteria bacterium]|nr:MAG: hypothetical protein DMF56_03300 [Acidobacteriota bacterium]